jgi:AbiV family abortive infection protein
MRQTLSPLKYQQLAIESLRNGVRLHIDSVLLYINKAYPSSLQLSILAMEEISKAKWVDHVYDAFVSNDNFPPERKFEQGWLNLLYMHPKKQYNFVARDMMAFSPKFVIDAKNRKLEDLKQKATYVGLKKIKNNVDVNSRVSTPFNIKENDAKRIISVVHTEIMDILEDRYNFNFDEIVAEIFDAVLIENLKAIDVKSGLKGKKWFADWKKNFDTYHRKLSQIQR